MTKEIWKDINDYAKYYQISNFGKVKSLPRFHRKQELILKHTISKGGYHRVPLTKNGKSKKYLISRLVALHFIPNTNNLPEVNHKDGNKANNKKSNLAWITPKGNILHAYKTKLRYATIGENCSWSKLTEKQVKDIRNRWKIGAYNMRELAEYFEVHKTTIWEIIHRKIWRHI